MSRPKITLTRSFSLVIIRYLQCLLNMGHVVRMFFHWQDFFYSGELGASGNMSGKLSMKLAICFLRNIDTDPSLSRSNSSTWVQLLFEGAPAFVHL